MDEVSPTPPARRLSGLRLFGLFALLLPAGGCLALDFSSHSDPPSSSCDGVTLKQSGRVVTVDTPNGLLEVFYPVPYVSTPHLHLSGSDLDEIELIDQKPDRFVLRKTHTWDRTVRWVAEGMPVTHRQPAATLGPLPVAEGPLPSEPVPVQAPKR